MLAAVLKELSKPLRLEEVETPSPGSDEVLIQVMACGTDATDLKLIDGFGYAPDLPFITGHEIAGVVSEFGDQVTDFKPGDRGRRPQFLYLRQVLTLPHKSGAVMY